MRINTSPGRCACAAGLTAFGLAVGGCGGGAATPATTDTTIAGKTQESPERAEPTRSGPSLSMYVAEPTRDAESGAYSTEITVFNTGDAPADVTAGRVRFETWRGDERVPCDLEGAELQGPPVVAPGDAIVYRATASCDVGPDQEIQAHVVFAADTPFFHRERHYVTGSEIGIGDDD
jgi:hypothetical protein